MTSMIDVFIKSLSVPSDLDEFRHSGQHTYCAPGMTEGLRGMTGFSGRLLDQESAELLPNLKSLGERYGDRLRIYDVGRFRGLLKAMSAGVWKTPAIIVEGEKHLGLEAVKAAISTLNES
jgi:hypothetical protein